jgi:hypothetical protein
MVRALKWSLAVAALAVGPAAAQLVGEHLLFAMLPGYTLGNESPTDYGTVGQWYPAGQTAADWTEMFGSQTYTKQWFVPWDYEATQVQGWMPNCAGTLTHQELVNDQENGYSAVTWQIGCSNNPATGKPENAWFKAIQATHSFYVVSRTYRYDLTAAQQTQVMQFMNSVMACDTENAEHRCPLVEMIQPPPSASALPATPPAAPAASTPPAAAPAAPANQQ